MGGGGDSGVLLVDKPEGPSSREVLDALERRFALGPLGHAGTLDPQASGLLVVLCGKARRLQDVFMGSRKTYEAELHLGEVSRTLDREGPITVTGRPVPELRPELLAAVLSRFLGTIEQVPPAHSAVRLAGRRAYELARSGRAVPLKPRRVRVESLEVVHAAGSTLRLNVACGPGTYVRSLARDIGEALGCGAWLAALRRTRSGALDVRDARGPDALEPEDMLPLPQVLSSHPRLDVTRDQARRLAMGQPIEASLPPDPGPAFAWHEDQPLCRLRPLPSGRVRSDLLLRRPQGC